MRVTEVITSMNKNGEYILSKHLSVYIRNQYPNVVFHFDTGSGTKLTMGQAVKMKCLNPLRGYPDLFIAEPRNGYNGLFIEIKKDGEKLLKRNKEFKTGHLEEQSSFLTILTAKGYKALFGVGYDECKKIIDEYLKS